MLELDAPQPQIDFAALGMRLSGLREKHSWTLDDLAVRSGLSLSYLSRVESGDRQPSLGTLSVLAQVYGVTLAALFEPEDDPCIIVRGGEADIQRGNALFYTRLSRRGSNNTMQAVRLVVSSQVTATYSHEGEEWLYVLSGKLNLTVGEEEHILEAGDAAHFAANVPHRFLAAVEQITEILIVAAVTKHPLLGSYL
jgi:transcriptional regulator with XRE-family HTH domain